MKQMKCNRVLMHDRNDGRETYRFENFEKIWKFGKKVKHWKSKID